VGESSQKLKKTIISKWISWYFLYE